MIPFTIGGVVVGVMILVGMLSVSEGRNGWVFILIGTLALYWCLVREQKDMR